MGQQGKMNVSLNTALYNAQGVDLINVEKIAGNILNSAKNQQPVVKEIDYSKFNRASLGIDLYSSRTNVQLQKQIAMNQAGLYVQSVNVAELNSKAAASLYSAANVQKNVSMAQSVQASEIAVPKTIEKPETQIRTFTITDSNSNSSNSNYNPFANTGKKDTTQNERAK